MNPKAEPANATPGQNRQIIAQGITVSSGQTKTMGHDMSRTMHGHWCRMWPVLTDGGKSRVLNESGQINNGPVHGKDQPRVYHII